MGGHRPIRCRRSGGANQRYFARRNHERHGRRHDRNDLPQDTISDNGSIPVGRITVVFVIPGDAHIARVPVDAANLSDQLPARDGHRQYDDKFDRQLCAYIAGGCRTHGRDCDGTLSVARRLLRNLSACPRWASAYFV